MNWDALGAIAELIGAIAVFLTLAYLTVQVRQNSKALELQNKFSAAQIMQARNDTLQNYLACMISSDKNIKTAIDLTALHESDPIDGYSKEEADRIFFILQMQRGLFENLYDQNKRGLLTEGFYEGSPTASLKTVAGALLAFKIPMSADFEREVKRVLALP